MALRDRVLQSATRIHVLVALLSVVPIVVAVVRAIVDRALPIGDNGLILVRSRDVFSMSHFPLLNLASSASLSSGTGINHPGPLLFDLLAVPVTVFGATAGMAVGVGLINLVCGLGVSAVGFRLGGRTGSMIGSAVVALLCWTLGSAILVEPWNAHVTILPCLLLFVVTAAVASGDLVFLPVLVAVASLCLQTHLSYAVLVPAMAVTALAGATLVYRRRWRADPACRAVDTPVLRRRAIVTVATFVVLWSQPLWQLVSKGRQGNLALLITSRDTDEPTIGVRLGIRIVASVVALPGGWGRSAFVDAVPDTSFEADRRTVRPANVASLGTAAIALTVVFALLAGLAVLAWRRRDRPATAAAAVGVAALAACLLSACVMPFGPIGLRVHQLRWLWALGPFLLFVVALVVLPQLAAALPHRRARRTTLGALGFVTAVFVVVALPGYVQAVGPNSELAALTPSRAITDQLADLRVDGDLVYDSTGSRFAEPYSTVVFAALQDGDHPWFVTDPYLIQQYGTGRRASGDEPYRFTVVEGFAAIQTPPDAERIAFSSPVSERDLQRLHASEDLLVAEIQRSGLVLSPQGRELVESGRYFVALDTFLDASGNADFLVRSGTVGALSADGGLIVDPDVQPVFDRVTEVQRRIGNDTVAVFLFPTGRG